MRRSEVQLSDTAFLFRMIQGLSLAHPSVLRYAPVRWHSTREKASGGAALCGLQAIG